MTQEKPEQKINTKATKGKSTDALSPVSALESLKEFASLIEKSAETFDPRYILKVFRELTPIRKQIDLDTLVSFINFVYPYTSEHRKYLLEALSYLSLIHI